MTLAEKVFSALRPFELCDIPVADIKDRLSLLTVAGRLRRVGAIGFAECHNEGALRRLRDLLVNCGLPNMITAPPLSNTNYLLDHFPREVVDVQREVDIEEEHKKQNRLLWVYADEADRQTVQTCLSNDETIGEVLGYPKCCVDQNTEKIRRVGLAFLRAIVDEVGTDPKKVRAALCGNLKVAIPDDLMADPNLLRTDQRYPFLLHTACDACLQNDDSPSFRMNTENEAFALDLNPEFHHSLSEVVALSCESAKLWGMDTLSWKEALTTQEQKTLDGLKDRSRAVIQRLRESGTTRSG